MTLRVEFFGCPLCGAESTAFRTETCPPRGNIPRDLTWMKCPDCGHVHTKHYWTPEGRKELLHTVREGQIFGGNLDEQRIMWSLAIQRLLPHVASKRPLPDTGRWIDVGVGNGGFLHTAEEFGFDAVGIDLRQFSVDRLTEWGLNAVCADAMDYDYSGASVVMLADVLEHVQDPAGLLNHIRRFRPAALFVSCPNMASLAWRFLEKTGQCPYWAEQEHYHNFTRASLYRLLNECGFTPVDYGISRRFTACMEIIAT